MPTTPTAIALSLCFAMSPYAVTRYGGQEPQPGWDDEADPEQDAEDQPAAEPAAGDPKPDASWGDEEQPAEPEAPTPPSEAATTPIPPGTPAGPPVRPPVKKGTGLIVGASITGGLAWVVALSRMAFVRQCSDEIQDSDVGTDDVTTCFFRAGIGNAMLAPVQWVLNYATWGLAPAAGAIRGRYDGIAYAYDKSPDRNAVGFIAGGATMLGIGVIGRIAMYPMFFKALRTCGGGDPGECSRNLRLQYFGVQFSAASIGLGAGLLAYGIAYNKNRKQYGTLLKQHALRLTPQVGWDYTGLALSGRF